MSIAVIDYGMGNLRSVSKAIEHVCGNRKVVVTDDADVISNADHIVFPGVGAIRDCIAELQRTELDHVIRSIYGKKPLLGVCLGMQALLTDSEENDGTQCLGLIGGHVRHFDVTRDEHGVKRKVPHMGWNEVRHAHAHRLWQGIDENARFYFVHSYFVQLDDNEHQAGATEYGVEFTSALSDAACFAVQFHPEKSQHDGLQLLKNFVEWDGAE